MIYAITDHFNPTNYSHDYQKALNIIRLSQVNHTFHTLLQDPEFYKRLWCRYISNDLPNSSAIELQKKYFQALYKLEFRETSFRRLRLSLREGWMCIFNRLYDPADYTPEKDREYDRVQLELEQSRERTEEQEEEFMSDRDDDEETRINRLLILAINGKGDISIIDRLLDGGADMKGVEHDALTEAIQSGRLDIVDHLLERGAVINSCSDHPLVTAARCGDIDIFNRFVELGEDFTVNENFALIMASWFGHTKIVSRLIELGVDLSARDHGALSTAVFHGRSEVISLLLKAGANLTIKSLRSAIQSRKPEMVDLLIKEGVDVKADDNEAFIYAVTGLCHIDGNGHFQRPKKQNSFKILQLLLDAGADVNARECEALRIAVDYGRHDVARMLLDAGSNAYVDIYKMAKRKHDCSIVKLLDEYLHTEE